jgi:hypothetical protein
MKCVPCKSITLRRQPQNQTRLQTTYLLRRKIYVFISLKIQKPEQNWYVWMSMQLCRWALMSNIQMEECCRTLLLEDKDSLCCHLIKCSAVHCHFCLCILMLTLKNLYFWQMKRNTWSFFWLMYEVWLLVFPQYCLPLVFIIPFQAG